MSDGGEKKGLFRRGAEAAKLAAGDFVAEQRRYHSAEAKQERAERIRNQPIAVHAHYLGGIAELPEGRPAVVHFSEDGVHAGDAAFYWWPQITEVAVEDASTFGDRITATRVAFLGPLALGFRKKTASRSAFLTIDTDDGPMMFEIKGQQLRDVQRKLAKTQKWRAAATTAPGAEPTVPAGWYPDPDGTGKRRWWDGDQWTDQRR